MKAIVAPSGDHDGAVSDVHRASTRHRCGAEVSGWTSSPSGSEIHSGPIGPNGPGNLAAPAPENAIAEPSGDQAGSPGQVQERESHSVRSSPDATSKTSSDCANPLPTSTVPGNASWSPCGDQDTGNIEHVSSHRRMTVASLRSP